MALPYKTKQCVAIAKDVLKQIRANKYIPTGMIYVGRVSDRHKNPFGYNAEGDAQEALKRIKSCRVCAVGAALLSAAKLYDDFPAAEVTSGYSCMLKLGEFFTREEVSSMEAAFENTGTKISRFGREKRLKLIMNHIIRNKGHFHRVELGA